MPRLGERAVDVEEDGAVIVHSGFFAPFFKQFFPYYMCVDVARGIASADATKGLSDRPLETFGADSPMQFDFYRKFFSVTSTDFASY